jgi:hypothetical protein
MITSKIGLEIGKMTLKIRQKQSMKMASQRLFIMVAAKSFIFSTRKKQPIVRVENTV